MPKKTKNNCLKKVLLIIGGGLLQTYAIFVARGMGLFVCVIDGDPEAPGRFIADDFICASTRDIPQAIRAAKRFQKRHNLHGVITCGTDVSYTVASVAKALGLKGISPHTATKASDKGLQRQTLKRHGVPVPDFYIVRELPEALTILARKKRPMVLKPADNMGARGVRRVQNGKELSHFWQETLQASRKQEVILEDYMPGPEVSIETLIIDGKVHLITLADRLINGLPCFIERGHTLPSNLPYKVQEACFRMAKRGIRALQIPFGPAKFDMKITAQGPIIGEMAARLSGGFHSQCTDPLSTGQQTIKAVIDQAMGLPVQIKDITPRFHFAAVERSLYPQPGKVKVIRGLEEARAMPGIHEIILNVSVGDILQPVTSNMGKAGHVIGWGKNRKDAIHVVHQAIKKIRVETYQPGRKGRS